MSDSTIPTMRPLPAPMLRRLAAIFYDLLLLTAIWWCLGLFAVALAGGEEVRAPQNRWLTLALAASTYLYFVLSWMNGGQTIGMKSWRLALQAADGQPPGMGQASLRFAAALLSLALAGLGFAWAGIDRQRLTLHDRISGTRLLMQAPRPPAAPAH
jgi:uncharacterized RDD family membrane protein YckC